MSPQVIHPASVQGVIANGAKPVKATVIAFKDKPGSLGAALRRPKKEKK